ncbi:hypothetical protein [Acinetobacter genomosp. 15BJ]|uniref:Jacalin-type lectin domain-containing protein n=1 Tax=Acinetobacter genomosp. 15BJ TaxID=106651 RepID=R9B5G4_9GAMM|nr:hypothetical protein [Acinetobacter genomosp. 15BJ]EOR07621.1 hypothetical protein F896_01994 [Acinetobacter genomosp. 15BJ]MCH7292183.1 hypothetical protein [Acinetobacter genomosp. 15BJ]MDO3656112.1 hypothetical protein [Acinetobacter genomosp. 15BJ]
MKMLAGQNQMSYGGHGGDFRSIQDTGGQQVLIRSGSLIDSIQIGNIKYGGNGGGATANFQLPPDGTFTLLRMCSNKNVISYLKLICNGIIYESGETSGNGDLDFGKGVKVSFAGISSGTYIDMILFKTYF